MNKRRTWIDYAIWAVAAVTAGLLVYLGYAMWMQNQYEKATSPAGRAAANLENVVRKKPGNAGARIALAQAYVAADRVNDAIDQYQAALKIEKENPVALVGLGQIAMSQKQWGTATGYWQRVIDKLEGGTYSQKDERLEQAYYYLGLTLIEQHKYEDAVANLKEALRIRPDASDTHYALAIAYKELDSLEKSEKELKIALAFDPKMPEANYEMGLLLAERSELATAAEHFRLSSDEAPKIDKPRLELQKLGTVEERVRKATSLRTSNVASATVEARIAVALDPDDKSALQVLGQLYEQQGDKDKALGMYEKLLEMNPEDKTVADAVARLKNGGK